MSVATLAAAAVSPTNDIAALRERALRLIAEAPAEQLSTVIAYFEVVRAAQQPPVEEAPNPLPPVPASLLRPSDEVLAAELNARFHDPRPTVSREEMMARMSERFA